MLSQMPTLCLLPKQPCPPNISHLLPRQTNPSNLQPHLCLLLPRQPSLSLQLQPSLSLQLQPSLSLQLQPSLSLLPPRQTNQSNLCVLLPQTNQPVQPTAQFNPPASQAAPLEPFAAPSQATYLKEEPWHQAQAGKFWKSLLDGKFEFEQREHVGVFTLSVPPPWHSSLLRSVLFVRRSIKEVYDRIFALGQAYMQKCRAKYAVEGVFLQL